MSSRAPSIRALSTHDAAREAGQDGRQDRAPWALRRLQLVELAVPQALFAAIMHRIDRFRSEPPRHELGYGDKDPPGSGGASMINENGSNSAPNASRKARKIGSARSELLPMRPGLPAALGAQTRPSATVIWGMLVENRAHLSRAVSSPSRPVRISVTFRARGPRLYPGSYCLVPPSGRQISGKAYILSRVLIEWCRANIYFRIDS
jgi:hypothetical protein